MVFLEILDGPESGRRVELGPGRHLVGRQAGADVRVSSGAVSSRHLEVEVGAEGTVRFRDLGSTNGTWSGGLKVTQGEWLPGTELKLGDLRLRLAGPEPASAPGPGEFRLESPAAREFLAEGGKGGAWLLRLGLVFFVGVAAWWFFRPGREVVSERASSLAGESGSGGDASSDWGAELGDLSASDADGGSGWTLPAGLEIREGTLVSSGGRQRAVQGIRFPVLGGSLALRAEVEGMRAWPCIEAGREGEDRPFATWCGVPLGGDEVEIPFPPDASWFRLGLVTEGAGSLSSLTGRPGRRAALAEELNDGRRALRFGAGLVLLHRDGSPLVSVSGAGGEWTPVEGGFDFQAAEDPAAGEEGQGWLRIASGPVTEDAGPFLILGEGGPVEAVRGTRVEASPGLLLGGEARRFWISFASPAAVRVGEGGALLSPAVSLRLRWNLAEALAAAARTARRVDEDARRGAVPDLLEATAELLRNWPLDEAQVGKALDLRQRVLERGRK
ncbi:MAG: FHA domain-containing protein, partial [Planctomycetota bacterium]